MTYRHDASSRQRRTDGSATALARGLGWFSIALVLNLVCAQMLKRAAQTRKPMRDYRDRRGLPRSPEVMRGIARDFEVPRDMRAPEAMRPFRSAGGEPPRPPRSGAAPGGGTAINRGFGVQVTIPGANGGKRRVQPLVVVARDERDAELVAAAAGGDHADARVLRELTPDEVRNYGLDLAVYGDTRALPALNL